MDDQPSLLAAAQAEMAAQRGENNAFGDLSAARAAVIAFDVTDQSVATLPKLRGAIPRIEWLIKTARAYGAPVFWCHLDPAAFDGPLGTILGEEAAAKAQSDLEPPHRQHPVKDAGFGTTDRRIARRGYTAFLPTLCHLPYLLKDMRVDTVILAGANTDISIDASARDAVATGFRVVIAGDACAAEDEARNDAALAILHRRFADVRPVEEIVTLLRRSPVST